MSGTVCGILDSFFNTGSSAQMQQSAFKVMFDFFERMATQGNATRVALQYGSGGTGTDYWDEANPFGENAFFVYKLLASASTERDYDLYVLGQWADGDAFGASPGDPGVSYQIDSHALIMAFREDGTSPWAGTTNNDGTDTKGTPVWTDGGSTVHVLDRSCSTALPAGSYVTNKEHMLTLGDIAGGTNRQIFVGDADGFVYLNQPNGADDWVLNYMGIYVPRTGFTPSFPVCALTNVTAALDTFYTTGYQYGLYSGATYYGGGIMGTDSAKDVGQLHVRTVDQIIKDANLQPNAQISPSELDEFPVYVFAYEYDCGLCGYLPTNLLASVGMVAQNETNTAATRAYVGYNTASYIKASIPWDGGAAPGTGSTRGGRVW